MSAISAAKSFFMVSSCVDSVWLAALPSTVREILRRIRLYSNRESKSFTSVTFCNNQGLFECEAAV